MMMSEKRFYEDYDGDNGTIIRSKFDDYKVFEFGISDSSDLCELLNALDDKNTELELIIIRLKDALYNAMETLLYEYSGTLEEDLSEMNEAYNSINIYDFINYCEED